LSLDPFCYRHTLLDTLSIFDVKSWNICIARKRFCRFFIHQYIRYQLTNVTTINGILMAKNSLRASTEKCSVNRPPSRASKRMMSVLIKVWWEVSHGVLGNSATSRLTEMKVPGRKKSVTRVMIRIDTVSCCVFSASMLI